MKPTIITTLLSLSVLLASVLSVQADDKGLAALLPEKLQDAKGKEVSRDTLDGKIIGFYFSAEWCPPCRAFTPSLVKFRNDNKKDFEVVFISSDRTPEAHKEYMKNYKMDFLTLPHRSADATKLAQQYGIRGIPALVIVDSKGNLITPNGRAEVANNPSGALKDWQAKAK